MKQSVFLVTSVNRGVSGAVRAVCAVSRGLLILVLTALFVLPAHAAGDAAAGAKKAYTCLGCHGVKHYVNTYPTFHVPRIAGQHEAYLVAALKAYRGKLRSHQSMQANTGLLTDQDIDDIAAYFASVGGEAVAAASGADAPEKANTCAACHGSDGNSTADTNPILAGQYKSYLRHALSSYKDGSRQNAIMSGFAATLTNADIKELAEYFSSNDGSLKTAPRP